MDKIAFLLPSLAHGGAQKVFLEMAAFLCNQGLSVTLVVLDKEGELLEQIPDGTIIHFINKQRVARRSVLSWLFTGMKLRRWAIENDVSAIYSTVTGMNLLTLLMFYFSRQHQLIIREASSLENVTSLFTRFAIKWLYPRADYIICTSSYLATQLKTLCSPKRMGVIPNPIDMERIKQLSIRKASGEAAKYANYTIVSVGRLVRAKGYDILIEAFSKLNSRDDSCLLIVGEGPEKEALLEQIDDLSLRGHVHLLGYQKNPYAFIAEADLFVLSSRWEGYVNTVVEAMVLEKKIVATDCKSEPGNYLRDELNQSLVPVDDALALARAIEEAFGLEVPDYSTLLSRHRMAVASQQYLECVNA